MPTPEQVELVQQSWAKVAPISDQAADLFYGRLFELDPELRPMFTEDMSEQKKKLMQTLGLCVTSLKKLDDILPAVQELGRKHVDYGVKDEQYETVGAALLWTLAQGLGDDFTPAVEEAWTDTIHALAGVMIEAGHQVA